MGSVLACEMQSLGSVSHVVTRIFPSYLDSEQEVPPGAAEAVQSVDYYCDSKFSDLTL